MLLHDIPQENTKPRISERWERALGAFQHRFDNFHPIVLTVHNNVVIHAGYRNGNFYGQLQAEDFESDYLIRDWSNPASHPQHDLDWSLVEIIYA